MDKKAKKKIVSKWDANIIEDITLALYSEREFGRHLYVFSDGRIVTADSSERLRGDDSELVAILGTPGHGNIDFDLFLGCFAHWDDEQEAYIETNGTIIGDIGDVINDCFQNGDISSLCDQVHSDILEQIDELF